MGLVPASRRISAVVAFAAAGGAIVFAIVELARRPLPLLATIACIAVAIAFGSFAITRTGARRAIALVVTILALLAPILLTLAFGDALAPLVFVALEVIAFGAARHALGRDIASLKAGPTPGVEVGPAERPI